MVTIEIKGTSAASERYNSPDAIKPLYCETVGEEIDFSMRNLGNPTGAPPCFERILALAPEKAISGIDTYLASVSQLTPNTDLADHFLGYVYPAIKKLGLEKEFEQKGFCIKETACVPGAKKEVLITFKGNDYHGYF
jgi:hypothetical protein